MNRFLRLLGYRDRKYRGTDFNIRIESISHEALSVTYETDEKTLYFSAGYIGRRSQPTGIGVDIPPEIEHAQAKAIAVRLIEAFNHMGYGYYISHKLDRGKRPRYEMLGKSEGLSWPESKR
ncbi:MAG: hypothetical protein JWO13_2986 [Acidobacteriales bacterium]|nr:hypothetical protein [Terriglobales bacterium]